MKPNSVKKGMLVTVKERVEAYGYKDLYLEPGEVVEVVNPRTPCVRGHVPYFAYCEFVKNGENQRVGLHYKNMALPTPAQEAL